jgi:tellurite resistance protein TerA
LKDVWRFAAVGQGFNGGLSALLKHFGGEDIKEQDPQPASYTPKPPVTVKLNKTGDTHKVNLAKGSQELIVHVNLNWNARSSGFFSQALGKPDLDLGCMYQTLDGEIGVIQPLGGNFGSKTASPYIFLDKDDRSGSAADGENMYLYKPSTLRRVMFFALIYQGATDFRSVSGRMFFKIGNGDTVTLELNNPSSNTRLCAAALITNDNRQISISKEEKYFPGHQQADKFYGFGFIWTAGSK